jgi:hypothetical protein
LCDLAAAMSGLRSSTMLRAARADTCSDSDCGNPAIIRRIEQHWTAYPAPHRASATNGDLRAFLGHEKFQGPSRTRSFQMRLAFSHAVLDRHRVARPVRCAVAVILMSAWSGIPATVPAHGDPLPQMNGPSPPTIGQGPLPAPIGHRQPRPQDLPPDVLRDEGMTRQPPEPAPASRPDASGGRGGRRAGQTPLGDNQLQICRGC